MVKEIKDLFWESIDKEDADTAYKCLCELASTGDDDFEMESNLIILQRKIMKERANESQFGK